MLLFALFALAGGNEGGVKMRKRIYNENGFSLKLLSIPLSLIMSIPILFCAVKQGNIKLAIIGIIFLIVLPIIFHCLGTDS